MAHLVFLSLGSRGDLQPLVSLAIEYKKRYPEHNITFVATDFLQETFKDHFSHFKLDYVPVQQANTEKERREEMIRIWNATRPLRPTQLIYSTFTLEGYSIAEKLQIPSILISNFPVRLYPIPPDFQLTLQTVLPDLYRQLQPHWPHIEHWLWRLFQDDHSDFRQTLQLEPEPRLQTIPPFFYALDPTLFRDYPSDLATAVGSWALPSLHHQIPLVTDQPFLLICFGSMDYLAPDLISPDLAFLDRLGWPQDIQVVWMAHPALRERLRQRRILTVASCDHQAFVRRHPNLIGVVHHGGVGSSMTMLRLGLHQVVVPFMFDQEGWADRLVGLGLARRLEDGWSVVVDWMRRKLAEPRIRYFQNMIDSNAKTGIELVIQELYQNTKKSLE